MTQGNDLPPAPPRHEIERSLRRIRRRLLGARALRHLSLDSILALSAICGVIVLDRVLVPGIAGWPVLGGILAAAVAISLLRTLLFDGLSLARTAIVADSRLELRERVSSALALGDAPAEQRELRQLIEADARKSIAAAPIRTTFPISVPRFALWNLAPIAAAVALALWVPALDLLGIGGRKEAVARDKKAVEEGKKVLDEKLADLVKKAEQQNLPDAKKLLELLAQQPAAEKKEPTDPQAAEKAAGDPRKEALVELTRREDAIKKGQEGQKFEPLKDALKALKGLELKNLTVTKKLQEALKDGDLQKAKKELSDLKDEMWKLAQKPSSELTEAEKERLQKLAEELSKLAKDSKAMSKLSGALSKASSQLSQGQMSESLESLEKSAEELSSLSELADELAMLDQALELVELSKEELAKLTSCPMCGTPYCPDCGKPQCACQPQNKPGGT